MRRHLPFLLVLLVMVLVWLWLQPSSAGRHFNRGLEANHRGDWAAAEEHFSQAISDETFPRRAEAYSTRGVAREQLGRMTDAMADHHAAVALAPDNANIRTACGKARGDLGDFTGAMGEYNAALAVDPKCAEARYNRGALLWALGRYEQGEADLLLAQQLRPDMRERIARVKTKKKHE